MAVVPEGLDERSLAVYCLESVYEVQPSQRDGMRGCLLVHSDEEECFIPGLETDHLVPTARRSLHTVPTARVRC
jgi:hypothetical protein